MKDDIIITECMQGEPVPYTLLLIADPSKENVDAYIPGSRIYTAVLQGETIGCYALYDLGSHSMEIKNIAVSEKHQGRGIGTALLNHAIENARVLGVQTLVIGTGNSSIGQLHLYQKLGFRITGIKKDLFRDNYKDRIFENGIECIDMIMLEMRL